MVSFLQMTLNEKFSQEWDTEFLFVFPFTVIFFDILTFLLMIQEYILEEHHQYHSCFLMPWLDMVT